MESIEITEERFIECMAADFPTFKITKSNLTHPTSQFVISFYSLVLRQAIDLNNPDEIWNITEDQRAYLNSYHQEAATFNQHVYAQNLHAAIKYVFDYLSENGTEFIYSDILFPENTPRRSFVFMALMLNFYWYINDFASELNDKMAACVKDVEIIKNLKWEKENLIMQLKEIQDRKSLYAESIKDIKKLLIRNNEINEKKEEELKKFLEEEEVIVKDVDKVEEEEQKLQAVLTKMQNEKKYFESLVVTNQNQVVDVLQKNVIKKEECVKKMNVLKEQAKVAAKKLSQNNGVLELQEKLNYLLSEDKFLEDSRSEFKGFQNLYESINSLLEEKKKLTEEKCLIENKITEAEEALPKSQNTYSKSSIEQQDILSKQKEKINSYNKIIDDHKKNHLQIFLKIKKDSEEMEEFISGSVEMNAKCSKLEEEIKSIDIINEEMYKNYAHQMQMAIDSVQGILGDEKKFFFQ